MDKLKVQQPVSPRIPDEKSFLTWLQREVHTLLGQLRTVLNWAVDQLGLAMVDSTDTPADLETKLVGSTRVTVTKTGAVGSRTLVFDIAPDYRVWDPTFYIAGLLNSAEVLASFPVVRYATLAATLAGAFGSVRVAPLADATITIKQERAGVETTVGTITIASGALQCVFTCAADIDLVPGTDYLNFVNQAIADVQMAGLRVCIPGVRT